MIRVKLTNCHIRHGTEYNNKLLYLNNWQIVILDYQNNNKSFFFFLKQHLKVIDKYLSYIHKYIRANCAHSDPIKWLFGGVGVTPCPPLIFLAFHFYNLDSPILIYGNINFFSSNHFLSLSLALLFLNDRLVRYIEWQFLKC
jgi:hypothetical protein